MWRFLTQIENTSQSSPLYLRVCSRLGLAGYGLGANAVLRYASIFRNQRDLKFIAPFHPRQIQRRVIAGIDGRLPILTGTGDQDTVSGELELFESMENARSPAIMVVLNGTRSHPATLPRILAARLNVNISSPRVCLSVSVRVCVSQVVHLFLPL